MCNIKIVKKIISFLFILIIGTNLYCQELLDNQNASWTRVLPGTVITEPVYTSYGFCLETDDKNLVAISDKGSILWEKSFARTKNIHIASLSCDFILFFDNDKSLMKLINPSGSLVWERKIPIKVKKSATSVFTGRDGRFIIKDDSSIYCYGMNGICRWKITSQSLKDLSPQELPDGSIIFFTEEKDGLTCGIRVSPFGEIMEEITFSGQVIQSCWCQDGVLLSFKDGTAGLFSLEDGLAKNKWVFNVKVQGLSFVSSEDHQKVCALQPAENNVTVHVLDAKTGNSKKTFKIENLKGNKLAKAIFNSTGLFICDYERAFLYKTDGTMLWCGRFEGQNLKSAWNYLTFTDDNYLILSRKNWTLDSFRLYQKSSSASDSAGKKKAQCKYPDFIEVNTAQFEYFYGGFDSKFTNPAIISQLQKGDYSYKEIDWLSNALSTGFAYTSKLTKSQFNMRSEQTVFEEDGPGLEKILAQLPYFATSDSAELCAEIIRKSSNITILNAVLKGLSQCGYDPEGKILSALEFAASKIDKKNITTIQSICDAVVSVCIYMGKPAYFSKGREILKSFMSANYDARSREYVRSALSKLW
ncbi:MAG: hypothetical protein K5681_08880 [Treponema sp.]|nr:hypothetical protein [Treponema sp.]